MNRLSAIEKKTILSLFDRSKSADQIAAGIQRSKKTVLNFLNKEGKYYRGEYTPYSNEVLKRAFSLRLDGLTWPEIARELGIKHDCIRLQLQVCRVVSRAPKKRQSDR